MLRKGRFCLFSTGMKRFRSVHQYHLILVICHTPGVKSLVLSTIKMLLTLTVNVRPPTLSRASKTTTLSPDSDSSLAADIPKAKLNQVLKFYIKKRFFQNLDQPNHHIINLLIYLK